MEAVETLIYLNEILAAGRRTRFNQAVTPLDYAAMIKGDKPPLAAGMSDEFFPRLCDQPWDATDKALTRYGCKMATGSGKTVVMAMLVAWSFCNRGAVPGDTRFPSAVVVACPNLTVRERLQVLRTDGDSEKSYYAIFDIVQSDLGQLLDDAVAERSGRPPSQYQTQHFSLKLPSSPLIASKRFGMVVATSKPLFVSVVASINSNHAEAPTIADRWNLFSKLSVFWKLIK